MSSICFVIADESVIALANGCPHLRSLDLYYCQNITDRAMYSLANSCVNHNHGSRRISSIDKGGLMNLNISQCTALTPPAVQAVCNSFPELHTCPERHSLIISGCLSLTSVHCACAIQANRASRTALASHAYWTSTNVWFQQLSKDQSFTWRAFVQDCTEYDGSGYLYRFLVLKTLDLGVYGWGL